VPFFVYSRVVGIQQQHRRIIYLEILKHEWTLRVDEVNVIRAQTLIEAHIRCFCTAPSRNHHPLLVWFVRMQLMHGEVERLGCGVLIDGLCHGHASLIADPRNVGINTKGQKRGRGFVSARDRSTGARWGRSHIRIHTPTHTHTHTHTPKQAIPLHIRSYAHTHTHIHTHTHTHTRAHTHTHTHAHVFATFRIETVYTVRRSHVPGVRAVALDSCFAMAKSATRSKARPGLLPKESLRCGRTRSQSIRSRPRILQRSCP
jgi:hypothetical protein